MGKKDEKRTFGTVQRLPSGRYQARYLAPDGKRHPAHTTFEDKDTALAWLRKERMYVESHPDTWLPPKVRVAAGISKRQTFGDFAESWLKSRRTKQGRPLAGRTRDHYRDLLDRYILPTFGDMPLAFIDSDTVDRWYEAMPDLPTTRAHAYGLMRTILNTAVDKQKIPSNPCRVRGGGNVERAKKIEPATLQEIATIVANMPERRRLMVTLAAWTGLRFGEIAELRRKDIKTRSGYIDVSRGVVRVRDIDEDGNVTIVRQVKTPKTKAGVRKVYLPTQVMADVRQHLLEHAAPGDDGLLFPAADGGQLSPASFYGRETTFRRDGSVIRKGHGYHEARRVAGRPDLHFHALRHTALTTAAQHGATLAELMDIAGHTTPAAAMRYQHAAQERLASLAQRMYDSAQGER